MAEEKLSTACEHCGETYLMLSTYAGKKVTCKGCGEKFTIVFSAKKTTTSLPTVEKKLSEDELKTIRDLEKYVPDHLMHNVSKSRMTSTLSLAIIAHVILMALLSVTFIMQCIEHNTIHPKAVIAQIEKEKAEAAKEEKKRLAKEERAQKAKEEALAKLEKEKAMEKEKMTPAATGLDHKTKMLNELNEVSDERPVASGLESIDDVL